MNHTINAKTLERLTADWKKACDAVDEATARLTNSWASKSHERAALERRLHNLESRQDEAARRLFNHLVGE